MPTPAVNFHDGRFFFELTTNDFRLNPLDLAEIKHILRRAAEVLHFDGKAVLFQ